MDKIDMQPKKAFITETEMRSHKSPQDLWIAIDTCVYNLSHFDHPGGLSILLEYAGQDATEAFERYGHSDEAYEMLKIYYVGRLLRSD